MITRQWAPPPQAAPCPQLSCIQSTGPQHGHAPASMMPILQPRQSLPLHIIHRCIQSHGTLHTRARRGSLLAIHQSTGGGLVLSRRTERGNAPGFQRLQHNGDRILRCIAVQREQCLYSWCPCCCQGPFPEGPSWRRMACDCPKTSAHRSCTRHPVVHHHHAPVTLWYSTIMHPSPCGIAPSCTCHPVVYHHHAPVTLWYITIMHPSPCGIAPSCTCHPVVYHHHAPVTLWYITIMHPSPCGIAPSCTCHPVVYHHHAPVTLWYSTIMHPSPCGISPSCTCHPVVYHHHAPITLWYSTIMHPSPCGIAPSCTRHPVV